MNSTKRRVETYRKSGEAWKILPHDPIYAISTFGRLRNLMTGKLRVFSKDGGGYPSTVLRNGGKTRKIHRLVAETFIPNPKNKPNINHKNAVRGDNRVENLEWCTQSENVKHSYAIGTMNRTGSKNNQAKLREKDIPIIRM